MFGARLRFFQKIFFAIYCEYINGKYFDIENNENPNPYGLYYEDVRGGFIFWQGLDKEYTDRWTKTFPMTFWDEIYSDITYYKRDDDNIIGYLNVKAGARLLRIHKTVLDYYFVSYSMFDKHGDFWNNKIDFGIGFRLKPWADFELSLFTEALKCEYVDRDGRYENPYPAVFNDVRIGLLFWYGIGD